MQWEAIALADPFLAGAIAARGYEWWDETSAESEAESVGLVGEQRARFLAGWQHELADREQERKSERAKELDDMLDAADQGWDPAERLRGATSRVRPGDCNGQ